MKDALGYRWTPEERNWVDLKWAQIRRAQQQADESNNEWKRVNDALNDFLDGQRITDIVQRTKIKSASIPLKDALGTGSWHARNAERHIHDLQLYLKMKEMGLL